MMGAEGRQQRQLFEIQPLHDIFVGGPRRAHFQNSKSSKIIVRVFYFALLLIERTTANKIDASDVISDLAN